MGPIYEYIFSDLNLEDKLVLDAATGAGRATRAWAEAIQFQRARAKIISVDHDQPPEWVVQLTDLLGDLAQFVDFREADIFSLSLLPDQSVDIVNCDNTIVFLNPRPLRLLAAFQEFKRVLKPGGKLIVVSELPVENSPECRGQWQRWQLAKSIWALSGEVWAVEPLPEEVEAALMQMDFSVVAQQQFPGARLCNFEGIVNEWRERMLDKIAGLPWSELREPLRREVAAVCARIETDGYLSAPGRYVLKCVRQ